MLMKQELTHRSACRSRKQFLGSCGRNMFELSMEKEGEEANILLRSSRNEFQNEEEDKKQRSRMSPIPKGSQVRHHIRTQKTMTMRTTQYNLTSSKLMFIISIILHLQIISRPQNSKMSQVHCLPQVLSSSSSSSSPQKSLGSLINGQTTNSLSPDLVAANPPYATQFVKKRSTSIEEASSEFGTIEDLNLASNQNHKHLEEEATASTNNRRQAPEMQPSNHLTVAANAASTSNSGSSKLRIVRLLAPEATQNGTQNVTLDCMFKFDRNLDQRLTIKWFFNDELEPIYQWIPELNKRVYSDKYERFLDKSYEVSNDVDFMLQSYRWLLQSSPGNSIGSGGVAQDGLNSGQANKEISETEEEDKEEEDQLERREEDQLVASRRLLAGRLNKLAKLGGRHSRQLIESLRSALHMHQLEFSRFRALRLIGPTTELNGRFTCSVSSLDGDDLRSTKLVVYEPAKSFSFNVSRLPGGQQYNLSCQAGNIFPRPTLNLYRYRAGPLLESREQQQQSQQKQQSNVKNRPKLAATLLRQEPLVGTQTQITISATGQYKQSQQRSNEDNINDIRDLASESDNNPNDQQQQQQSVYEISSWALVDESSLSSNVVTQFECQLFIEGTGYEQRQSLALQRGWHVNSASLTSRHTLVGLFSALASILCLMLALVSSLLIFRLLKRHAKNRRVHQLNNKSDEGSNESPGIETNRTDSTSPSGGDGGALSADASRPITNTLNGMLTHDDAITQAKAATQYLSGAQPTNYFTTTMGKGKQLDKQPTDLDDVYRVPEPKSYGTRFVIGHGSVGQYYGGGTNIVGPASFSPNKPQTSYQQRLQQQQQQQSQLLHQPSPAIINLEHSRPLYC